MMTENQSGGEEQLHLSWQYPKGLIGLSFANMLLRILTLGIYHFWAKTEVRKRIWSAIRINDEPLTYTGRGLELFIGFLIVFFLFFVPLILLIFALALLLGPQSPLLNLITLLIYIAFAYLIGVAIYRAQRYRMARTRWRGIRGSLEGSPHAYAWTYFWTLLLIPLTLGWIVPWRTTKLQSILTNNIRFGNRPLRFDAESGALYGPFTLLWFGSIVVYIALVGFFAGWFADLAQAAQDGVPLSLELQDYVVIFATIIIAGLLFALFGSWYQARTINHFANHTHFENATFSGDTIAFGLIWLSFSNFLILLAGSVIFLGIAVGLILPFFELDLSRLPDGRAAAQVLGTLAPIVLLFGFTLFMPIVQARTVGYVVRNLQVKGTAPIEEIAQSTGEDIKYGEGLAEAFDVDV